MKKTTKKNLSKDSRKKKAIKDLGVKPSKGGTIRGGTQGFEKWIEL